MNQAMAYALTVVLIWAAVMMSGCGYREPEKFFNPRDLYHKLDKQAPLVGDDDAIQSER